jgi:hypothetical protein
MTTAEMPLDELTHRIIGAAIEVHGILGPGLLESVYQECLTVELRQCDLSVDRERHVPLNYKGRRIDSQLKLDLLVEGRVIVEGQSRGRPSSDPSSTGRYVFEAHWISGRSTDELQFNRSEVGIKAHGSSGLVREENSLLIS